MTFQFRTMANRSTANFLERRSMTNKDSESGASRSISDKALAFRDKKSKSPIVKRRRPKGSPQSPDPAKQETNQNPPEAPLSIDSVAMKNCDPRMVNKSTKAETLVSKQESVPTRKEKRALAKVEKNIAEIQKWYDVGRKLANDCPTKFAQGGLIEKQAEELGIRAAIARTYRQMSGLYTQAELNTLYQKFRENLFALTISHFYSLVTVKDKRKRKKLAFDAVEGRWSVRELQKQKHQRFEKQNINAGRTPKNIKGEGTSALIDAVKSELAKWLWWMNLLLKKHKEIQSPLQDPLKVLLDQIKGVHKLSQEQI